MAHKTAFTLSCKGTPANDKTFCSPAQENTVNKIHHRVKTTSAVLYPATPTSAQLASTYMLGMQPHPVPFHIPSHHFATLTCRNCAAATTYQTTTSRNHPISQQKSRNNKAATTQPHTCSLPSKGRCSDELTLPVRIPNAALPPPFSGPAGTNSPLPDPNSPCSGPHPSSSGLGCSPATNSCARATSSSQFILQLVYTCSTSACTATAAASDSRSPSTPMLALKANT